MNMKSILVGLALLITLEGCVVCAPLTPKVIYAPPAPAPVIVDYGYYPILYPPVLVAPLIWPYGYCRPYGYWHGRR